LLARRRSAPGAARSRIGRSDIIAELSPQVSIAFLLYPQVTQLDLTGPAQFLSRIGGTVHYVAKTAAPVPTDAGFSIVPTATFADVTSADILCVPGGISCVDVIEDEETLAWVRGVGEGADWVTSVCTGSLILGAAGLLRGYRAACHWAWREHLALFGAEPVAERVVFDRNRVTGGGVTAGIDFALALIGAIRGEAHARLIQLALEYDPAPPFDSGSPDRAPPELLAFYSKRMEALAPGRDARIRAAAERLRETAE
jgi:cyclohexyl-isocyanide hydratase